LLKKDASAVARHVHVYVEKSVEKQHDGMQKHVKCDLPPPNHFNLLTVYGLLIKLVA